LRVVRLLVVVDDRGSRRELAHVLTELGHTVATSSVADGLARFGRERFDLVVAELPTAGGAGVKLVKAIRRHEPATPVVVLSGSPKVEATLGGLGTDVVDVLPTPIDRNRVESVLRHVEKGLGPGGAQAEGAVTVAVHRSPADSISPSLASTSAHDLGEGRLELGIPDGRVQKVLRIDATGAPPNLLVRLLVGSYITGQDQVLITARSGLTTAQRKEIHQLVDRTVGMSVVGDSPEVVEVQNFVDPGKHELPHLLHRVVQMLRAELEVCRSALLAREGPALSLVGTIEEEVDRFYLLMVRQLLLSSDNPRVARNIDVESHHFQIGYRLVAKVLEVTGDLIQGIGSELEHHLPAVRRLPPALLRELAHRLERLDHLLTRTMDAFDRLSVVDANATLNVIGEAMAKDADFGQRICRRIPNQRVAVAVQRIGYNLDMALEMLVIVNEVTINRSVEPETVARTGTRVPMGPRRSPSPAGPSGTRGGRAPVGSARTAGS
jgi:CheY-like chemotaxis protein